MAPKLTSAALTLGLALSAGFALHHDHPSVSDHSSSFVRTGHPIDGGPPIYPAIVAPRPLPTAIHPITPR